MHPMEVQHERVHLLRGRMAESSENPHVTDCCIAACALAMALHPLAHLQVGPVFS